MSEFQEVLHRDCASTTLMMWMGWRLNLWQFIYFSYFLCILVGWLECKEEGQFGWWLISLWIRDEIYCESCMFIWLRLVVRWWFLLDYLKNCLMWKQPCNPAYSCIDSLWFAVLSIKKGTYVAEIKFCNLCKDLARLIYSLVISSIVYLDDKKF